MKAKIATIALTAVLAVAATMPAFADGPGQCGEFRYWDKKACECKDARNK